MAHALAVARQLVLYAGLVVGVGGRAEGQRAVEQGHALGGACVYLAGAHPPVERAGPQLAVAPGACQAVEAAERCLGDALAAAGKVEGAQPPGYAVEAAVYRIEVIAVAPRGRLRREQPQQHRSQHGHEARGAARSREQGVVYVDCGAHFVLVLPLPPGAPAPRQPCHGGNLGGAATCSKGNEEAASRDGTAARFWFI